MKNQNGFLLFPLKSFFKYNCSQMELTGCLRNVLLKVNIVAERIVQTALGVTLRLLLSVSALSVLPL